MAQLCPFVNSIGAKAGSLLHTDTQGRDLPDAPGVRL
jgi:hypothetical protein